MQSTLSPYSQQSIRYRYWQAPRWQNPRFASAATEPIKLAPGGYFAPEVDFEKNFQALLNGIYNYWVNKMNKTGKRKPVIIAMDDTPLSKSYLSYAIEYFTKRQIDVDTYYHEPWGELPMPLGQVGYFAKHFSKSNEKAKSVAGALMFTSGSRPWSIGDVRFINNKGALFNANELTEVQSLIHQNKERLSTVSLPPSGEHIKFDFMKGHYREHLRRLIDMKQIETSNIYPIYDARQGAAKNIFNDLLTPEIKEADFYNHEPQNYNRMLGSPSLNNKNLKELSKHTRGRVNCNGASLANNADGSACRILDEMGRLISYADMLALCLYHLVENKSRQGVLIKPHHMTGLVDQLAATYGIPVKDTPIGYQHVARESQKTAEPLLIAGDGDGGFILPHHVPIKDGLLMNFLMLELHVMAQKPFGEILEQLKKRVSHCYTHSHLQLKTSKEKVDNFIQYMRSMVLRHFHWGPFRLDRGQTQQHYRWVKQRYGVRNDVKLFFEDGASVVVRQAREKPEHIDFYVTTAMPKSFFGPPSVKQQKAKHKELINAIESTLDVRFSVPKGSLSVMA